jgi:anti-anti-sigma factor
MEIVQRFDEDVHVLQLLGNFDVGDVGSFEAHVRAGVDAQQSRVALDANEMTFICSAAIASLVQIRTLLQRHGGELTIFGLPRFAAGVFRTLGLDHHLHCFETLDEATRWLRALDGADEPSPPTDEHIEEPRQGERDVGAET